MYQPMKGQYGGVSQSMTMMARKGMNEEVFSPFQGPEFADLIVNYFVDADGSLIKRKGQQKQAEVASISGFDFIEGWLGKLVVGYENTVAIYDPVAETFTTVKGDFSAGKITGKPYGNYFFVNSPDGVWRISLTLAYDAQTANFTADKVLTGKTSGAQATILEDDDSGTTGTLTLSKNFTSTAFADNEIITDTVTGSATVNGTLTYAIEEVTAAPKGSIMEIIGPRMFIGALESDGTAVQFSDLDDGTNPPFNTWSIGTGTTNGGLITNKTAGDVTGIDSVAQFFVIWYENGKAAYYFNTIEESGSLKRVDVLQMDRRDMGGSGPSLGTPKGLFYVNEGGLYSLVGIGQPNVPYSDQEMQASAVLGPEYFEDIDFSNGSMLYDPVTETLFITCARNSDVNNLVLAYNFKNQAFSEIRGWSLADFHNTGSTFYGVSSVNGELYTLFDGSDDDGFNISTDFIQEIKLGSLTNRNDILKLYGNAQLWSSSDVTVSIGTFDREGAYTDAEASFNWVGGSDDDSYEEYGSAAFGGAAWGGGYAVTGSVNSFNGCSPMIRNVQRAKLRVQSNDSSPHVINFFQIQTRTKAPFRRREMTRTT